MAPGDPTAEEVERFVSEGHARAMARDWAAAADAYEAAVALAPDYPCLPAGIVYARMKVCDWTGFDAAVSNIVQKIEAGRLPSVPFDLVALPVSPEVQLKCASLYTRWRHGAHIQPAPPLAPPGGRIRIGYFSADFYEHATAFLAAELFDLHDRDRFEITAFAWGPGKGGAMRQRLQGGFDRFCEIDGASDDEVVQLARRLPLDIAVDLKGYTTNERSRLFARRLAPIQVSYLGFPMTMGAPFMDALVADPVLVQPGEEGRYTESVARLPHCYQPNDRRRDVGPRTERADHGLPPDAFVFAALNPTYKTTPAAFAAWMRILAAVPRSVLWVLADVPAALANLREVAARHGVDPRRIVPAGTKRQPIHLERLRHADLFLDAWPCSAHTTASDALWTGLPLLTLKGETFAGRVAASLLLASSLPELVAHDPADFVARAVSLAGDPQALAALRRRVEGVRATSPVFDTPGYSRDLESLYAELVARTQSQSTAR